MTQFLLSKFGFSFADTSFVFCGHSFLRAILHLSSSNSKQFTTSQTRTFPPTAGFMILPKGKAPSSHRSSKYPSRTQLFASSSAKYNDSSRKRDDAEQKVECESHGGSLWSVNWTLFARYLLVMANTFQGHRRTFSNQQSFHSSLWQNEVARKLGNSFE